MKEVLVSNYSLEVLADNTFPFSYKELTVSNYNLEVLSDFSTTFAYKELHVSNYNLEVLCSYVDLVLTTKGYIFSGNVLENSASVVRQVSAYNQTTLLPESYTASAPDGSFSLTVTAQTEHFLVCLDDTSGLSYNALVVASITPLLNITYGLSPSNPGKSAYDIKLNNPVAIYNGIYWIKPSGYTASVQVYCDMTTQGGGWTMCARWDRDFPTGWVRVLSNGAMRSNINVSDMVYINSLGIAQCATINVIPIISDGAKMFMHVSMDIYDTHWKYCFFSEIYQDVLDTPNNIFNPSIDTNDPETATGTVVSSSSYYRNRWFNASMRDVSAEPSLGYNICNYFLNGGEGRAMFTYGSQNGAIYSSHNQSNCQYIYDPFVCWSFYGKDGTLPTDSFTYPSLVGSAVSNSHKPTCRFNFMFIR